jgi:hypothetical protein
MKSGELIAKQIKGIAMGMSPAPPITNLFVSIFEEENMVDKIDGYIESLKRCINSGI